MGFAPAFAFVIGSIDFAPDAAVVTDEVNNIRIGGRDRDSHSTDLLTSGKPLGQKFPSLARVSGLVNSAARTSDNIVPSLPIALPGNGIQDLIIGRVDGNFHNTYLLGNVEDLFPCLATVGGFKNAALLVVGVLMAKGSNIHDVIILRIDDDAADVVSVVESHVLPCATRVDRFKYPRPGKRTTCHVRFTSADPDQVRVLVRYRDDRDRGSRLVLKDRFPSRAIVEGFP